MTQLYTNFSTKLGHLFWNGESTYLRSGRWKCKSKFLFWNAMFSTKCDYHFRVVINFWACNFFDAANYYGCWSITILTINFVLISEVSNSRIRVAHTADALYNTNSWINVCLCVCLCFVSGYFAYSHLLLWHFLEAAIARGNRRISSWSAHWCLRLLVVSLRPASAWITWIDQYR